MASKVLLREWLDAVCDCNWDSAASLLGPNVSIDGNELLGADYIQRLQSTTAHTFTDREAEIELLIIDDGGARLAARVIHRARVVKQREAAKASGQSRQWAEQLFLWAPEGKITKVISLDDVNDQDEAPPTMSPTPDIEQRHSQQEHSLKPFYTEYINSINEHTMDKNFSKYCNPSVMHNDFIYSTQEYREMIESSFEDISGLHFTIEELFTNSNSQHVAARLGFTGIPVKTFRGIPPTGKSVRFSEHAFYKLEQGKISRVWSILDLDSFRKCMLE